MGSLCRVAAYLNNRINSDWEKLRRFAMQLFSAGYAERSAGENKWVLLKNMFLRILQ